MTDKQVICLIDKQGRMIEGFPGWKSFTGQPEDEARGLGWIDILDRRGAGIIRRVVMGYKPEPAIGEEAGQATVPLEIYKSNQEVLICAAALKRFESSDLWVVAVTQESYREPADNSFLSEIKIDHFTDAFAYVRASDGVIVRVSARYEKILGYGPGELEGKKVYELNAPSEYSPQEVAQMIIATLKEKGEWQGEVKNLRKDGKVVTLEYHISTIVMPGGELVWYGTAKDITKTRKALSELRLSTEVIENAKEGVVVTDTNGLIVSVNPSVARITGFGVEELLGKNPRIWKSGTHSHKFYENMWYHVKNEGKWEGEIWNRKKNGELYPARVMISAICDEQGEVVNYTSVMSDLSEWKEHQKEFEQHVIRDQLTSLPSKILFADRLDQRILRSRRDGSHFGLLYINIDHFQNINESLGHIVGDNLLREVGERIYESIRGMDSVSRESADHYMVLLDVLAQDEDARVAARRIQETLKEPFYFNGNLLSVSASIGIVISAGIENTGKIIKNAQKAMMHARTTGRGQIFFFDANLNQSVLESVRIEEMIREAIIHEKVEAYFQPKVDLESGRLCGMEALARIVSDEGKVIEASEFMKMAEASSLILELGEVILEKCIQQIATWRAGGVEPVPISMNLSVRQFYDPQLADMVFSRLEYYDIPPSLIGLEVTESIIMENPDESKKILARLREGGISITLENFGEGYSSLSTLYKFPVDIVKIDQSFIEKITEGGEERQLASSIIQVGKNLNLAVVAEGVENADQFHFLLKEECDQIQGYFISSAIDRELTSDLLQVEERIDGRISGSY